MYSEERNIERIKRFGLDCKVADRCFHNGVEYVDLGLPSGTKWATMNVGAKSIVDWGLYFQWGDTEGYTREQIKNGDKEFSSLDYKYAEGRFFTKYNSRDGKNVLDLEDDAAHFHLGSDWRMPTSEEIDELIVHTLIKKAAINNTICVKLISKRYNDRCIFIPFTGFTYSRGIHYHCGDGFFWSSSHYIYDDSAYALHTYNVSSYCGGRVRIVGIPIRGVFK